MRKIVFILLVLCLVGAVAFGTISMQKGTGMNPLTAGAEIPNSSDGASSPTDHLAVGSEYQSTEADAVTSAEPQNEIGSLDDIPVVTGIDYAGIYALHEPEDMVLEIGGQGERWRDYFFALYSQCSKIENYFERLGTFYGIFYSWDDPIQEDSEETFAQSALNTAEKLMIQLRSLEVFAEENGITLDDEDLRKVEEQRKQDLISYVGEDGTEEDFRKAREKLYLSDEMYERILKQNVLYQEGFKQMYGENAEKYSDEDTLRFLEENEYVSAAHILLLTIDPGNGEDLEESVLTEKKVQLEALLEELRTIEDEQERKEAFLAKVAEISEEIGKEKYPEGYIFTDGAMMPVLEKAVKNLEEYEISDIVESSYGYHILLRLPLEADAIVKLNASTNEPRTARMTAANEEYGEKLQATADALSLQWLPGCEPPDLLEYVSK